jgi:hypothetical protein
MGRTLLTCLLIWSDRRFALCTQPFLLSVGISPFGSSRTAFAGGTICSGRELEAVDTVPFRFGFGRLLLSIQSLLPLPNVLVLIPLVTSLRTLEAGGQSVHSGHKALRSYGDGTPLCRSFSVCVLCGSDCTTTERVPLWPHHNWDIAPSPYDPHTSL